MMQRHVIAVFLLGTTLLPALQGCVPLVATGATMGALATFDRRSLGTQTEDEGLEWKVAARLRDNISDKAHINVTSYNRKVLLTGEVPTEDFKAVAETVTLKVPNVQSVYNELTVGPASDFSTRSNDSFITSKVKSRSVDSGKFNPVHVKVITESNIVFLLGMVTQPEADAAIEVARTTAGVKKVVNLLEIITPAKARELDITQSNNSKTSPQ